MTRTPREWIAWVSPGLMVVVGLVLFFIPAPPTSLIGIVLIIVGGVLLLGDYFGGETRGREEDSTVEPEPTVESEPAVEGTPEDD